jgi:glycosyltransferase involved in cell wall biosynthesis
VYKFSVVIPAFNASSTILDSLRSIEIQTLRPNEVIIVNDGSTDNTLDVIRNYKLNSNLIIRIINNKKNRGICYSLNEGLSKAKYDWIARMDADDICRVDRFEKQFKYIEDRNLDVCGSYIQLFDKQKKLEIITYPVSNKGIRNSLLFSCPIAHPTVIFDRSITKNIKYDVEYEGVEDLALWVKMAQEHTIRFGNVREILLDYRVSYTQYSKKLSEDLRAPMIEKLRDDMINTIKREYDFCNSRDVIKYIKETKAELIDNLSIIRLKYYSLRIGNKFKLNPWDIIWIIWFAGFFRFLKERVKSFL